MDEAERAGAGVPDGASGPDGAERVVGFAFAGALVGVGVGGVELASGPETRARSGMRAGVVGASGTDEAMDVVGAVAAVGVAS